jgi:hypothetical protein
MEPTNGLCAAKAIGPGSESLSEAFSIAREGLALSSDAREIAGVNAPTRLLVAA